MILGWVTYSSHKREQHMKQLEEKMTKAGIREIDVMTGEEFEDYLAVLFKRYGYQVEMTPGSNDFGADLILEGSERIVVQAKRYRRTVGIKAVQEIHSAKLYYHAQEAWVITNNYFSANAIELAVSTGIRLIDREELLDMILTLSKSESAETRTSRYARKG